MLGFMPKLVVSNYHYFILWLFMIWFCFILAVMIFSSITTICNNSQCIYTVKAKPILTSILWKILSANLGQFSFLTFENCTKTVVQKANRVCKQTAYI